MYGRNPKSMRTVPRVCAAGRDSVPSGLIPGAPGTRKIRENLRFFIKRHVFGGSNLGGETRLARLGSWGALGALLGHSWDALGVFLGCSWALLGALGVLLGALGVLLGRSWGALGALLGALGAFLRTSPFYIHILPINRLCGRYVIFISLSQCSSSSIGE